MRALPTPESLRLVRAVDGRVLSGVAAGLAGRFAVDVLIVRLAFIVLATAGGFGGVLYIAGWLWLPEESPRIPVERHTPMARHALAVGFLVAGALLLLRSAGAWWSDTLTWSVALAALGSGIVWTQASAGERAQWHTAVTKAVGDRQLPDATLVGPIRPVIGGSLVLAGVITFLFNSPFTVGDTGALFDVVIASAVTLVGVGLVIGPWLQRLGSQVADERRERIRSEERAEMAAHLHDSVLQTLALIQRADSHDEVTRLARSQERELRSWLFGRAPDDAPSKLGQAIEDTAARVEERFGVPVEVVLAGEVALAPELVAMVEAAGEAMTNAAKHSGADHVDVFVEVESDQVTVFVRDEGDGFDAAAVAADRHGLSHSIIDRMRRHGGCATIHSEAGEGTEVELTLPLDGSTHEEDE